MLYMACIAGSCSVVFHYLYDTYPKSGIFVHHGCELSGYCTLLNRFRELSWLVDYETDISLHSHAATFLCGYDPLFSALERDDPWSVQWAFRHGYSLSCDRLYLEGLVKRIAFARKGIVQFGVHHSVPRCLERINLHYIFDRVPSAMAGEFFIRLFGVYISLGAQCGFREILTYLPSYSFTEGPARCLISHHSSRYQLKEVLYHFPQYTEISDYMCPLSSS